VLTANWQLLCCVTIAFSEPAGAALFHASRKKNGQKDIRQLMVAFRNFSDVPDNESCRIWGRKKPTARSAGTVRLQSEHAQ